MRIGFDEEEDRANGISISAGGIRVVSRLSTDASA
jgi:hypothetical protein